MYLFGSQATNKTCPSSDVDIGILLDTYDRAIETEKRNQYLVELANNTIDSLKAMHTDRNYEFILPDSLWSRR